MCVALRGGIQDSGKVELHHSASKINLSSCCLLEEGWIVQTESA